MEGHYCQAGITPKKAVTQGALGDAEAIEEHFSLRFLGALIRSELNLDPNELDDDEWALRAGEAFFMMELHSPNWGKKNDDE